MRTTTGGNTIAGENTIDPIEHTHADPKDGPPPRSWLDKGVARLVALAIAVALAAVLVLSLGDDVQALVRGEDPTMDENAEFRVENPATAACIEQRTGHVDGMLQDGVITQAQHASFRENAIWMCTQGVPAVR